VRSKPFDTLSLISYNNDNSKIYQNENGRQPFIKWLESIKDLTTKARIKNRVAHIALGNFGDCKIIGQGVSELRLHFGSGYRGYFGKINNVAILLLGGGDKSSQTKNIKQAMRCWEDFEKSL